MDNVDIPKWLEQHGLTFTEKGMGNIVKKMIHQI